ncbi:hypothetical protein A7U60_g6291 [Sanghuangporus baumii]|uniref:Uncharacterized protein n=1 Tax=Sanghuangporus baumii TaxID=108892 RepID=A0A9Q5N7F0_SANBA|nr:hypothetical protein A7U60_g6291 [Sanghuangporus baumii]
MLKLTEYLLLKMPLQRATSERKLKILEQTRNARLARIHDAKKENVSERKTRSISSSITRLSTELERHKEQLTEVQRLSDRQYHVNEALRTTVETLQKSKNSAEKHLEESQHVLGNATNRLDRSRNRASATNQQLRNSQKTVQRLRGEQVSLSEENNQLRKELAQMEEKLTEMKLNSDMLQRQLSLQLQSLQTSDSMLHSSRLECFSSANRVSYLEGNVRIFQIQDYNYKVKIRDLRMHNIQMRKSCSALRIRLSRFQKRTSLFKDSALKTIRLTEKGVYTPRVRCLVRRIASSGVSLEKCGVVVGEFLRFLCIFLGVSEGDGKTKIRIPSPRTIRRIVGEGNVASKLQLGLGLKQTEGFTIGGDGTTNRNLNYEAMHLHLNDTVGSDSENPSTRHTTYFGEVRQSANHRSETQVKGDTQFLHGLVELFNRSPLATLVSMSRQSSSSSLWSPLPSQSNTLSLPLSVCTLAPKFHGSHGDHAEDQKAKHRLLSEWKSEMTLRGLGAEYILSMPDEERNAAFWKEKEEMILQIGESEWNLMSKEEKKKSNLSVMEKVTEKLAEVALQSLPEEARRRIMMFAWCGCGMHKDLNAVKGGDLAMREEWKKHGIAPVLLANRDNAAVLEAAEAEADGDSPRQESPAEKRAREVSESGGSKLSKLMGANSSLAPGYHDEFCGFMLSYIGRPIRYPDTSLTRYTSFLNAAAENLANYDLYLKFMEYIRYRKVKPDLNHLESNVLKGLLDKPTLTELACQALYHEAVSIPYINSIRGSKLEDTNGLTLDNLLQKVKSHIRKLIDDPDIILAPTSQPREAIMGGNESWNCPDAIKAIQVHITMDRLPKLKDLFKAFLKGALDTWKRFSSEFEDGGTIAALTEAEKDLAWMPSTNDVNEGALGSYRLFARKTPHGSLSLFNSLFRYRRNNTEEFISTYLSDDGLQAFLRKEARAEDQMGTDRKRSREIAEQHEEEARTKKQKRDEWDARVRKRDEELRGLAIEFDRDHVNEMTAPELKNQLDKLRKMKDNVLKIPPNKDLGRKDERKVALLAALDQYSNIIDVSGAETVTQQE